MKKIIISACLLILCVSGFAQPNALQLKGESKKMAEIMSVININNLQSTAINSALMKKKSQIEAIDSTLSSKEIAFKKYEIEKAYHEDFISQLSEKQVADYCKIVFSPEVSAKTDYRISLLLDVDNDYTESEIEVARNEIYKYLMLEKIVYFKYKYDFAKQKENISRLKGIQPSSLKASINNEKQKGYNKVVCGKVNWKNNKQTRKTHE